MLTHFGGPSSNTFESIEQFSRPHPLSTEAAVASLKRYLPEPRYRIQLSDLIDKTVERVAEVTSGEAFAVQDGPTPTSESVTARVRRYEAACSTLLAMAPIGGFWAEEEHYPVWQRALQRLGSRTSSSGTVLWLELQRYPATLLLYALGLGAVEADQLPFLKRMFSTTLREKHRQKDLPAIEVLPPCCSRVAKAMKILEGMDKRRLPLNDWIHDALRPHAARIIPDNDRYTLVFDKLEILMALSYAHQEADRSSERYWAPFGAFGYRSANCDSILREMEESLSAEGNSSPFVKSGVFGETAEDCKQSLAALKNFVSKLGWGW